MKEAGGFYSMFYVDAEGEDSSMTSKRRKVFLGSIINMSLRAARHEHSKIMDEVNKQRGSSAPVIRGQTFGDAVTMWQQAVAPNLSPSTVRARESYLRVHIIPRFGALALHEIGVHQIQQFATDLKTVVSGKTVVHVLGTVFAILRYAERCGLRVKRVGFTDLQLGSTVREDPVAFFTREQASQIIEVAREPFKTMFALAWLTALRAGELLALTVDDLDFNNQTLRVNKSADDRTREIRAPKTKKSIAVLPLPSALASIVRNYLTHHWKPNPTGLLFPNRSGTRPRSRNKVVTVGLKPVLRKLGISDKDVGLHAFRHGLATELAQAAVPIPVLQQQMRHADVQTTLRVYAHAIPQSQRDALERVASQLVRKPELVQKIASN